MPKKPLKCVSAVLFMGNVIEAGQMVPDDMPEEMVAALMKDGVISDVIAESKPEPKPEPKVSVGKFPKVEG